MTNDTERRISMITHPGTDRLGKSLYEAWSAGMSNEGIQVEEAWEDLEVSARAAWRAAASHVQDVYRELNKG